MKTRILGALVSLALAGCIQSPGGSPDGGPDLFSCPVTEGSAGLAAFRDFASGDPNRPDQATRDSNGVLVVSGPHAGGRLILTFIGAPQSGAILVRTDAGCEPSEGAFFYLPKGAGDAGGGEWASAQLTVSDGGADVDGGQRTNLALTQLTSATWLKGALPNRSFELTLP